MYVRAYKHMHTHTPYAYKYICKEQEVWAWAGIQKISGPVGFLQDRSVLVSGLFFECTPCLWLSCSPSYFPKSKKGNDLPFPTSDLYPPGWTHSPRKRIAWSPNQTKQAVDPPQSPNFSQTVPCTILTQYPWSIDPQTDR